MTSRTRSGVRAGIYCARKGVGNLEKMLRLLLVCFSLPLCGIRGDELDEPQVVLVTVKNGTQGFGVRLHRAPTGHYHSDFFEQKIAEGLFVSPECSGSCSQLTVVRTAVTDAANSATSQASVVILPSDKAFGLLKFHAGKLSEGQLYVMDLSKYNCSPAAVFRIQQDHFYSACYNSGLGLLTFLRLIIDTGNVAKSLIPALEYPSLPSVHNLTNFVYADLPNDTGPYVFFAVGYALLRFIPFDLIITEIDIGLEELGCFVTELGYTGGWELVVYCSDNRALYVSLKDHYVFYKLIFAREGRPYVCPDPNAYLGVHFDEHFIQYVNRSTQSAKSFDAPLESYDNGVCLGTENTTTFVFTDRERGTRLVNVSGGFVESLSRWPCTSYPCQPLVVLDSRYLVLREQRDQGDWHISVFDSRNNFSLVLEVPHSQADLMGVVELSGGTEITTATPDIIDLPREGLTDDGGKKDSGVEHELIFSIVGPVSFVTVILLLVLAVSLTMAYRRCFGRTEKYPKPIAEQGLPKDTPKVQPTGQKDLHPCVQETSEGGALRDDDSLASIEMPLGEDRAVHEARKKRQKHIRSPL